MSQELPYLPEGREILYVNDADEFLAAAEASARELTTDHEHPTGAVVVRDGVILGVGANRSEYHAEKGCERKKQNCPTGEGYELCPGCGPEFHAEQQAIGDAGECVGADLYLWGHWWCCESCWKKMIAAGIRNVYLWDEAVERFKK